MSALLELHRVECASGDTQVLSGLNLQVAADSLVCLLRPDDVITDPQGGIKATVEKRAFCGADILYTLRLPGGERVFPLFSSHCDHVEGEQVTVRIDAEHVVTFPR